MEIADRTGDSFVTVRHQYYRGLKKLRPRADRSKACLPDNKEIPEHESDMKCFVRLPPEV